MSLPGSGLISASCIAYRKTNGVPMPGVSAGSRNTGAIDASKATVSCPSGWPCASADPYHPARTKKETRAIPRVSARISSLLTVVWRSLRGLPLVGGRLGSRGEVDDVAVRGPPAQRRRVDLVVAQPALPVPRHHDLPVGSRDPDEAIRDPEVARRRRRRRRRLGQRPRGRAGEALEESARRRGPAGRRLELTQRDRRDPDVQHAHRADQNRKRPQAHSTPPLLARPPSTSAHAPSLAANGDAPRGFSSRLHRRFIFGRYGVDGPTTITDSERQVKGGSRWHTRPAGAPPRAGFGDGYAHMRR